MFRFTVFILVLISCMAAASAWAQSDDATLRAAFVGAQVVDLRTSKISSVVTLRDKVGIPAPSEAVYVKVFDRKALPPGLREAFSRRAGMVGLTINSRYIAIIRTELRDEYADTLRHELVHAYISLASPKPLPLWFHEGSAVHFSMGKDWKFYGQPAKDQVGVMVGKTVELPNDYKQKLQSFNFLMQTVGEEKFFKWYRNAVETGDVDTRALLGLDPAGEQPRRGRSIWAYVAVGAVVLGILVAAYISSKRESDYY